jgi:hypothetical protein
MTKHGGFAGIDLKQFFEASVDALQNDRGYAEIGNQKVRHNCPLVERGRIRGNLTNRALADAARALTALWDT